MIYKMVFLCAAGFTAALVDSIAGGGGLINLPALLIMGIPPHFALGTNKFSSTAASFTSSIKFSASGKVNFKILKLLIPFTFLGAAIGVKTALSLNKKYLYIMILVLLILVGLYSLFSKSIGIENKFTGINKKNIFYGMILAFSLGFYDGFFGPGAGSFLIFGIIWIYGYDFVNAAGNAKVLNFVSNVTAFILFAIYRQINYILGIPIAIFMILGAQIGTKLALNRGTKLIKPIFVTMSLAAACKMFFNIVK